ncbi:MAG: response regulator [Sphingobacteriales bacterium]|uniref:response regulator n=1 Tax=Hydrotalea flava TaxID=714549 RepID=UPI00082FE151|nr:response regulator [Hydrotalea flava]RTL52338.1 MAG: response regulator [Sphingobacteriales bacterium]
MQKHTKSVTLLVVEDNSGDYLLLDEYLRERFDEVTIARAITYKEAAALLQQQHSFQVVLLDLSLPDISGEALVKEMMAIAGDIPIIVLTGYADIEFSIASLSFGIADYLLKDDIQADVIYKSIVYAIERKKVLCLLQESEKKYSSLFQFSPQPMWVYHPQTLEILEVNNAAEVAYGYSRNHFLKMHISDIFLEKEFAKWIAANSANASIQNYLDAAVVYNHRKKQGEILLVNILTSGIEYNNMTCVLMVAHDVSEQTLLKRSLEEAYANIVSVEEQERERFAADIHDGVTQNLIALKVYFSFLKKSMEKENNVITENIVDLLEKSIRDCKDIVSNIRPKALIDNGLFAGLTTLVQQMAEASAIHIDTHVDLSLEHYFDFNAQLNIYRIIQECINNLLKHAQATAAVLSITREDAHMKIVFFDNGKGIAEEVLTRQSSFLSMKRRTAVLNGRFHVQNNRNVGARFTFHFPLKNIPHSARSF